MILKVLAIAVFSASITRFAVGANTNEVIISYTFPLVLNPGDVAVVPVLPETESLPLPEAEDEGSNETKPLPLENPCVPCFAYITELVELLEASTTPETEPAPELETEEEAEAPTIAIVPY